ncbi:uncharacterized protein LOC113863024 [Abrus precatorius]|uniref:Uncharacterized protein LOC113863024 n=1 Tax=Abrus precatorius TaxID=3816 RepID=A0A8B8LA88_ABRPR|nr:uncharacterized protein LOC113863024 [Abrus precatorius]
MVHTKKRNCLKQKMMNDVIYVIANSKLGNIIKRRKEPNFDVEDVASDDDWIVEEENELISDMNLDENLIQDGEASSGVDSASTPMDDLDLPPADDDESNVDDIDKHDYIEDDYPDWGLQNLL